MASPALLLRPLVTRVIVPAATAAVTYWGLKRLGKPKRVQVENVSLELSRKWLDNTAPAVIDECRKYGRERRSLGYRLGTWRHCEVPCTMHLFRLDKEVLKSERGVEAVVAQLTTGSPVFENPKDRKIESMEMTQFNGHRPERVVTMSVKGGQSRYRIKTFIYQVGSEESPVVYALCGVSDPRNPLAGQAIDKELNHTASHFLVTRV